MSYPLTLEVRIDNLAKTIAMYNRIRIDRAPKEVYGGISEDDWVELTGRVDSSASIILNGAGPFTTLAGKTLLWLIDRKFEYEITFTEDEYTLEQLVSKLRELFGYDYMVAIGTSGDQCAVTSAQKGEHSHLIVSGTALDDLGITSNESSGKQRWVDIDHHNRIYSFVDYDGSEDEYQYRVRFYQYPTGAESEPVRVFSGPQVGVASDKLSVCSFTILDASGNGLHSQRAVFYPQENLNLGDSAVVADKPVYGDTDHEGSCEVTLLRGVLYRVVITGTGFVRDIRVPDAESFDLFSAAVSETEDRFTIRVPDEEIYLVRRS